MLGINSDILLILFKDYSEACIACNCTPATTSALANLHRLQRHMLVGLQKHRDGIARLNSAP